MFKSVLVPLVGSALSAPGLPLPNVWRRLPAHD
jgi:hypothetical protein